MSHIDVAIANGKVLAEMQNLPGEEPLVQIGRWSKP